VINYLNGTSSLLIDSEANIDKFFEGEETFFPLQTANSLLVIGAVIRRYPMGETEY
jgi:hypothetical protein